MAWSTLSIEDALLAYTAVCAFFVALGLLRQEGILHPAVLFPLVYYYLTAGPVIQMLLGFPVTRHIREDYVPQSLAVFSTAALGMGLGLLAMRRTGKRPGLTPMSLRSKRRFLWSLAAIGTLANAVIAVVVIYPRAGSLVGANKGEAFKGVEIVHYNYLLLWMILVALALAAWGDRFWKRSALFTANFALAIAYQLLTGERDWVLYALAVLFAFSERGLRSSLGGGTGAPRSGSGRPIAIGAAVFALLCGFTAVAITRSGESLDWSSLSGQILGQGSNALVTTNVLAWVDSGMGLRYGETYLHSVINLAPSFLWRAGVPLTIWFQEELSGSLEGSGYGFTLEAEGYLNFGLAGVLATFSVIGVTVGAAHRAFVRGTLGGRFAFLYCFILSLYSVRGDSLMVMKAVVYGGAAGLALMAVCARKDGGPSCDPGVDA